MPSLQILKLHISISCVFAKTRQIQRPPIMKFHTQHRDCHAERSEASPCPSSQTLRFAQGDTPVLPILIVKNHNRGATACSNIMAQIDKKEKKKSIIMYYCLRAFQTI